MGNWQKEAYRLYFDEHKKIIEIADLLKKTRKTISVYLKSQPGFEDEKNKRKLENKEKRPEYKRNLEKRNRLFTEAAVLKRQHEIDVMVLSYERI